MKNSFAYQSAWILLAFVTYSTCTISGCNRIAATQLNHDATNVDEHDHFPSHWPGDIFKATDRLVAMKTQGNEVAKASDISPESEFVDLVRWLPMLAADSDLKEPEFNSIDRWCTEFTPSIETQVRKGTSLGDIVATAGIQEGIRKLESIIQEERDRKAHAEGTGEIIVTYPSREAN